MSCKFDLALRRCLLAALLAMPLMPALAQQPCPQPPPGWIVVDPWGPKGTLHNSAGVYVPCVGTNGLLVNAAGLDRWRTFLTRLDNAVQFVPGEARLTETSEAALRPLLAEVRPLSRVMRGGPFVVIVNADGEMRGATAWSLGVARAETLRRYFTAARGAAGIITFAPAAFTLSTQR